MQPAVWRAGARSSFGSKAFRGRCCALPASLLALRRERPCEPFNFGEPCRHGVAIAAQFRPAQLAGAVKGPLLPTAAPRQDVAVMDDDSASAITDLTCAAKLDELNCRLRCVDAMS